MGLEGKKLCLITEEKKTYRANSVDPVEIAQSEPPYLDRHYLKIQLFSCLAFLKFGLNLFVSKTSMHNIYCDDTYI